MSISVWYKNGNILLQISKYVIFRKLLSEWYVPGALVSDVKCIRLIAYFIMRQSGKICSSVNDVYSSAKPQNCRTDRVLRIKSSKLRPVSLFFCFPFCRWIERERWAWRFYPSSIPHFHIFFHHFPPVKIQISLYCPSAEWRLLTYVYSSRSIQSSTVHLSCVFTVQQISFDKSLAVNECSVKVIQSPLEWSRPKCYLPG